MDKRFVYHEYSHTITDLDKNIGYTTLAFKKLCGVLNELNEKSKSFDDKNCYNCKYSIRWEDNDSSCKKGAMNIGGTFDWEYHQFKECVTCPLWEHDGSDW